MSDPYQGYPGPVLPRRNTDRMPGRSVPLYPFYMCRNVIQGRQGPCEERPAWEKCHMPGLFQATQSVCQRAGPEPAEEKDESDNDKNDCDNRFSLQECPDKFTAREVAHSRVIKT